MQTPLGSISLCYPRPGCKFSALILFSYFQEAQVILLRVPSHWHLSMTSQRGKVLRLFWCKHFCFCLPEKYCQPQLQNITPYCLCSIIVLYVGPSSYQRKILFRAVLNIATRCCYWYNRSEKESPLSSFPSLNCCVKLLCRESKL